MASPGERAVTAETADMCLEGVAGPPSVWLSLWVGAGAEATRDASSPVLEEGVVIGVDRVQRSVEIVETTPDWLLFFEKQNHDRGSSQIVENSILLKLNNI